MRDAFLISALLVSVFSDPQLPRPLNTSNVYDYNCPCIPEQIWVDVVFVIESTDSMSADGLKEVEAFLESTLDVLTVGQGARESRVGVVSYGEEAVEVANLTHFKNTSDFLETLEIPYVGGVRNNAEKALRTAITMLDDDEREGVRQVIVLIVSSLNTFQSDPFQISEDFKEDGGVLITIEFVQKHGLHVPNLYKLSSNGYNFTNFNTEFHSRDLIKGLCDANCFCPPSHAFQSYGQRRLPSAGCLLPSTLTASRYLAQRSCYEQNEKSFLPVIFDLSSNEFLLQQFPEEQTKNLKVWLGMEINGPKNLSWDNEQPFDISYAPFSGPLDEKCVYTEMNTELNKPRWFTDNCLDDQLYACQLKPCSTDNFCHSISGIKVL